MSSSSSSSSENKGAVYVSESVVASAVKAICELDHVPSCVALEFSVRSSGSLFFVRALREALQGALANNSISTLPRLAVLHDSHCCPGIVAAKRIVAELILHFGPTCCCFGEAPCPIVVLPNPFIKYDEAVIASKLLDAVSSVYSALPDEDDKQKIIIVAFDAELQCHSKNLQEAIKGKLGDIDCKSVVFCDQQLPHGETDSAEDEKNVLKFAGWRFPKDSLEHDNCGLIYVGSSRAGAFAMEVSVFARTFQSVLLPQSMNEGDDGEGDDGEGDDDEVPSDVKMMTARGRLGVAMRRSKAIEDVRTTDSLGILMATPAHSHNARTIQSLALKYGITNPTIFSMDRITEYKLAFFPEDHVSVFVVVACPYTLSFLDARRYDRPVVSGSECIFALTDDDEWVSRYTTDVTTALSYSQSH